MISNLKRLPMENVHNLRDIGGYPIGFDKMTKWHLFYRADGIFDLSESEVKFIIDNYKINTLIDLRSSTEIKNKPNNFENHGVVNYFNVQLLPEIPQGEPLEEKRIETLGDLYILLAKKSKNRFKEVFDIIYKTIPNPVLFHCTAGKDRTGIIAALLLSICGVKRDDIICDYEISFTYLKNSLEKIHDVSKPPRMHMLMSEASNMEKFLDYIDENYDTSEKFLLSCGVTENQISEIRNNFVVDIIFD